MKIVLADDERMARIVLSDMLRELYGDRVEIREARNGQELLELVRVVQPELALVDIRMGKMDGLRAISEMRTISPHTQSIIISGHADFSYAQKAITLEAAAYLLKPVSIEKLGREVERVMEKLTPLPDTAALPPEEEMLANVANLHLYLEKHYADKELSVKTTAEAFMITPNYLSTLFVKKYGCRFLDYLTNLRIRHAQELMADQSWLNISEIADRVGFKDARYFSKVFKKITGCLPTQYAERYR